MTIHPTGQEAPRPLACPMERYPRLRVSSGLIEKVEFWQKMMGYTITHHIDKHIKMKYRYFNRENNTKNLYLIGQHIVKSLVSTNCLLIVPLKSLSAWVTQRAYFASLIHAYRRAVRDMPMPPDTKCVSSRKIHTWTKMRFVDTRDHISTNT